MRKGTTKKLPNNPVLCAEHQIERTMERDFAQ